ncbi:MAG TPA: LptF/LptG family permease [Ferruginibacter sp.]|nr:LptF/LptG family permease [Ferruginibacter sp.]HMP21475.1 LptF/LptG family permease [Ferruginibacter sp.]
MIKKLDKLVIKAFAGPFIATFFIALFVLIMQTLWKYIDDLVGKDLDLLTIAQFTWYASASLLLLAIPIAILISSIMAFGNLGETFELIAIKSSGISLLRFIRPLVFICLLLCGVSFFFANNVVPYTNLKFRALYYDIGYKKPALDLKEGAFYTQITGYAIKVGKKEKDQKTIHNVVIYEQQNQLQDNGIFAEKGIMGLSPDAKYLEFLLQNGYRYQERGNLVDTSTEFIRLNFKEYRKRFDLSSFKLSKTDDSLFKNDSRMYSIRQLNRSIDSVKKVKQLYSDRLNREVESQLKYHLQPDSVWAKAKARPVGTPKKFTDLIPDSAKYTVFERALNITANIKNSYTYTGNDVDNKNAELRQANIEWHRKFSYSFACLVLFFIGAPLGSIIRKGGFGMPLVIAVIFFIVFHLLSIFGEKFAKEAVLSEALGMWMPVLILSPVGAFLTYKAIHDSQLFNKEFYYRLINNFKRFIRLQKSKV